MAPDTNCVSQFHHIHQSHTKQCLRRHTTPLNGLHGISQTWHSKWNEVTLQHLAPQCPNAGVIWSIRCGVELKKPNFQHDCLHNGPSLAPMLDLLKPVRTSFICGYKDQERRGLSNSTPQTPSWEPNSGSASPEIYSLLSQPKGSQTPFPWTVSHSSHIQSFRAPGPIFMSSIFSLESPGYKPEDMIRYDMVRYDMTWYMIYDTISMWIKIQQMQQNADIYLLQSYSTCFGYHSTRNM